MIGKIRRSCRHAQTAPKPHLPVTFDRRNTEMSGSTGAAAGQKLSRDDWRKKKELEEARKAGTAPAEVDESGR